MESQAFVRIYNSSDLGEKEKIRFRTFSEDFLKKTGTNVEYVVRSPGRVNLIGDHIDYHGFSVLPMAIERSIWFGCSFEKSTIDGGSLRIMNFDEASHPPVVCKHSFGHGYKLDKSHNWYYYVLCGYHGILSHKLLQVETEHVYEHAKELATNKIELEQADLKLKRLNSQNICLDADLPKASGLSSSSALVCAAAVATCLLLHKSSPDGDIAISSEEIGKICPKFEQLIGTHSGGMDQAVIMTAQEGFAKFVQFKPEFRCTNVRLPHNVDWLIAHCGVDYPKAATYGYNTRVLETKLAAAIIAKTIGHGRFNLDKTLILYDIKKILFPNKSASEIVNLLRTRIFDKSEYSIDEVCTRLGITRADLIAKFNTKEEFIRDILGNKVSLLNRCEHVFEEAERVEKFKSVCGSTNIDIKLLGNLMTESHKSLRTKYNCSHPALDTLVDTALGAGALGARLTGAGWGGCIVALVDSSKSAEVLEKLKQISRLCFKTEPQKGCNIVKA